MNKAGTESLIKIAQIHKEHLQFAIKSLADIFPISAEKVANVNEQEFLLLELLTGRFAKLQDFLGAKLIDAFLDSAGEVTEGLTMIDKVNKLEKFGIIENSDEWLVMRQLRNHLSHEYPDQPILTAEYLNQTYTLSKKLIQLADTIIESINNKV